MMEPLRAHLEEGEELLWSGRPMAWVLFSWSDIFWIPTSVMWLCVFGFVQYYALKAYLSGREALLLVNLVLLPFNLVGLHFLLGRFVPKVWRKKKTVYGVTNRRVLIVQPGKGGRSELVGAPLEALDSALHVTHNSPYQGSITLVKAPSFLRELYANTGLDFLASVFGPAPVVFYDIAGVEEVQECVKRAVESRRIYLAARAQT